MTTLNCGYELGETVEVDGELNRVVGEDCEDHYKPEGEKIWYPIFEPVS